MVGVVLLALDAVASPFAAHKWRYRLVVVHDAGRGGDWIEAQLDALRPTRDEQVARDVAVWVCRGDQASVDPSAGVDAPGMRLDPRAVKQSLGLKAPSVVLVGKDGSIDLVHTEVLPPAELHRRVDAMKRG